MSGSAEKRLSCSNCNCNAPSKRKPLRYQELYRQLENDGFQDAFIIAWDEGKQKKLNVHKVMMLAASKVLRTQLSSRWDSSEPVINLPETYSLEVAKVFVKLLYIDELDANLSLETVLQVASLCDMYMIEDAIFVCNQFVINKMDRQTCLQIYGAYERLQISNFDDVKAAALREIAWYSPSILSDSFLETCPESFWKGLLELECPEFCDDAEQLELQLFQTLLKWKNANPGVREGPFREALLPLIRFPLMTTETLAEKIFPTEVLSPTDVAEIFCFKSQSDKPVSEGNCKQRFPLYSRKQKLVRHEVELNELLHSCKKFDNIVLLPGDFIGPFALKQNQIKISGSGNLESRIICNGSLTHLTTDFLPVETSDSVFTNLQIICTCTFPTGLKNAVHFTVIGARNKICNIKTTYCAINIRGNFNQVKDSNLEGGVGIHVGLGKFNSLKDLTISTENAGILVDSDENFVENITVTKARFSVVCRNSSKGIFKNVTFKYGETWCGNGFLISGGSYNRIIGFSSSPLSPEKSVVLKADAILAGIAINGEGEGNEVRDFCGNKLSFGLLIYERNRNNVIHNFKSNDTMVAVRIVGPDSTNNFGNGISCKYSRKFLNAKNMQNVKGIEILAESFGNVFENVEIATEIGEDDAGENKMVTAFLNNPNVITGQHNSVQFFRSNFV